MKLGGGGGGGGNFLYVFLYVSIYRNNLNFIKHKLEKNLKGSQSKLEKILTN